MHSSDMKALAKECGIELDEPETDTIEDLNRDLTRYIDMSVVMQKEIDDLRASLKRIADLYPTRLSGPSAIARAALER